MRRLLTILAIVSPIQAHSACYLLYAQDNTLLHAETYPPYPIEAPGHNPHQQRAQARGQHLVISHEPCFKPEPIPVSIGRSPTSKSNLSTSSFQSTGPCMSPEQLDSIGRRCGARASSQRPGGL